MDDPRRVIGIILVVLCAALLPISGALGVSWLAIPQIVLGLAGIGLLAAVIVSPRDR
jgi:hypothetical protein